MIRYSLAEGISEEKLFEAAADIRDLWMSKQSGFQKWEIGMITASGQRMDLVYWESKDHADAATIAMKDIPKDHPWMTCYDPHSISTEKLQILTLL